jgi:hypothetical protein
MKLKTIKDGMVVYCRTEYEAKSLLSGLMSAGMNGKRDPVHIQIFLNLWNLVMSFITRK